MAVMDAIAVRSILKPRRPQRAWLSQAAICIIVVFEWRRRRRHRWFVRNQGEEHDDGGCLRRTDRIVGQGTMMVHDDGIPPLTSSRRRFPRLNRTGRSRFSAQRAAIAVVVVVAAGFVEDLETEKKNTQQPWRELLNA